MRTNIIDCFERTVEKNQNKIAVEHNNEQITFAELRKKALLLSNEIVSKVQDEINHPMAVFLPKEIFAVVADLGIVYSGNVFMNLDVKTPRDRINNILALIKPTVVITSSKYEKVFEQYEGCVIFVDMIKWEEADICVSDHKNQIIDTDPFCIINTSGSTGTPKGVVLNHRSFFDFMDWAIERFGFNGEEIMGSLSPIVFDIFDFELCMMMFLGSKLVLLDGGLAAFPARLLEALIQKKVSFIFWVPSIMVNIANMDLISRLPLPDLKMVWFAGEVFPTKQFLYWFDSLKQATFVNLYGPIEITLDCTYYVIEDRPEETTPLPIGIPCRNTDILILDEQNEKCGVGKEGELCVRGTSLAMGYYNNAEKTNLAFVQNPLNTSYPELIYRTGDVVLLGEDNLIYFKGRKDSLIKHMGYRIELGEIEHVLVNELKIVKNCCAVYNYSEKQIVLYYEHPEEISPKEFRKILSKVFPGYMIPGGYERMDLLPRNTNGKIDRLLLKEKVNEVVK